MSAGLVLLLHGPNLNLLGQREPQVYGYETLEDHEARVVTQLKTAGFDCQTHQSNSEGDIIDKVHSARGTTVGMIINSGAFTHYSWALHDALRSYSAPIVEVHLSNPSAREDFRHTSVVAPLAAGTISGFGPLSYDIAVQALVSLLSSNRNSNS
ncbi:MAG: type II 3-dehydroquinate dehydratase [Actinobacteria bacterium]|nr:type II 3-dehydroquinate dehydratase [Actinomycetota bacterium]